MSYPLPQLLKRQHNAVSAMLQHHLATASNITHHGQNAHTKQPDIMPNSTEIDCLPVAACSLVLQYAHSNNLMGHTGAEQIHRNVLKHFQWPGVAVNVSHFVRDCTACNHYKCRCTDYTQQQPRTLQDLFASMALDLKGPSPCTSTGKWFLVVMIDLFFSITCDKYMSPDNGKSSKKLILYTLKISTHTLLSDNGTLFLGHVWVVRFITTAIYYPRTNTIECSNQVLKTQQRLHAIKNHAS
ncbi:hypothetical protein PR048_016512 [Dryococelus australis]|uniref:Integrase zinc-binding domain-containing protein n=1 Tax=Dryococelus australis TaxID=614101 RepID=A0ABQ9HK02_9NEOP|nr:hypothetical protein PR048_016512 [Dryococelus australis]